MSSQVTRIESLLLGESFDAICSASVVYLAMDGNILASYNEVRALVDRAVKVALGKITDPDRRLKVMEILPQVCILSFYVDSLLAYNDEITADK
jgi:hypothetical protein